MKQQDPFRNSELDRARKKRHFFHSLISDKFKRHRSDTGLVEDRTSSVTIVRIIVGLLMIHLIIIGGVLLRGHMVKESGGMVAPTSITPPPSPVAPPVAAPVQDVLPQPVVAPPVATHTAAASHHITQPMEADEDIAEEITDEPVIITPPSVAAATEVHHRVAPGDTWYGIAAQYGTTEAALKEANPSQAQGVLRAGSTLSIPAGSRQSTVSTAQRTASARPAAATAAAPARAQETRAAAAVSSSAKVYTVQRGESLSRIARKVKIPMKELMQLNNIKDANRIHPGMQLRLSR